MNFHFEEEKAKEKRRKIIKELIIWGIEIGAVILLAFLFVHFCLLRTSMPGSSMDNTLANGQECIINKVSYLTFSPKRNDVIAFVQSEDEDLSKEDMIISIRRVIGLPGEKIKITGNQIFIDGEQLKEEFKTLPMASGGLAESEITLSDNEYFVLGDNRTDSEDSRFRSFGNVKKENIIGKLIFKLNPFSLVGKPTVTTEEGE